jgi:pyruvate kinase
MHLVLVSIEGSLEYLKPAAVFTRTDAGTSARRLAAFHLPVWTVAITPSAKTAQDLLFSGGVVPVQEPNVPDSWNTFVRDWVQQHQLSGAFALFTQRPSTKDADSNHRMEIIDL